MIKKLYRIEIDVPLLIRWHPEFPESLHEKHRNQAIYQIQGNRNPFINFPDLTECNQFPTIKKESQEIHSWDSFFGNFSHLLYVFPPFLLFELGGVFHVIL